MAFNWRRIFFPTASDLFAPHLHMQQLADSITSVVPVANRTERTAVVDRMVSEGKPPTAANPLIVYRADAPVGDRIEYSDNGTTWRRFTRPPRLTGGTLAGSLPSDTELSPQLVTGTIQPTADGTVPITWEAYPNAVVDVSPSLKFPGFNTTFATRVMATDVTLTGCNLIFFNRDDEVITDQTHQYVVSTSVWGG